MEIVIYLQKLLLMYLCENTQSLECDDVEYLKEKYLLCDGSNYITLRRIAALFPSLACNLLKYNKDIARPIPQCQLSDNETYPRPMTTRCLFSLIPLSPMIAKLKLIEAALLYQLMEQAKFNTIKTNNGDVDYSEHMRISLDYCSDDYLSDFEPNEKRIKQFNQLDLYRFGYPIVSVYEAAGKLETIVGKKWRSEIIDKFRLSGIDCD